VLLPALLSLLDKIQQLLFGVDAEFVVDVFDMGVHGVS
jgi:hypothetical protein